MKTLNHKLTASVALALMAGSLFAQQSRITLFQQNGTLTWTNAPGTNAFILEWTPTLTNSWSYAAPPLDLTISTDAETTVSVPLTPPMGFYRLLQGFGPQTLHGTWIALGSVTNVGVVYFISEGDGVITNFGIYNTPNPPATYTVSTNGTLTLTVLGQTLTGQFMPPNQIVFTGASTNEAVSASPVADAALCAGDWSGTLTETNDPNGLSNYSIDLAVNTNGFVNLSGDFTGTGWIFALAPTNGAIASFFYTTSSGNYDQFSISGTLTGNTITGQFNNDSGNGPNAIDGTFTLTRQ
jgi:hypothetical protein